MSVEACDRIVPSVLIPCLNEERFIVPCVESLLDGQDRKLIREVLIIDGGSRDATRSRITALAERHLEVRMLKNPGRYAAHGMNVGLKEARGGVHREGRRPRPLSPPVRRGPPPPPRRSTDGECRRRGGKRSRSMSIPARVISEAMGSVFGVVSFRTIQDERVREVDTVPFGCWPRSLFDEVGFFDETFIRAQDLEFNQRCRQAGYRIICVPSVRIAYSNRETFAALFRMIRQTGFWKIAVNRKHRSLSSYRQLAPVLLGCIVLIGFAVTAFAGSRWYLWNAAALLYLLLDIFVSAVRATVFRRGDRWKAFLLLVYCFAGMHASYFVGYLSGFCIAARQLGNPRRTRRRGERGDAWPGWIADSNLLITTVTSRWRNRARGVANAVRRSRFTVVDGLFLLLIGFAVFNIPVVWIGEDSIGFFDLYLIFFLVTYLTLERLFIPRPGGSGSGPELHYSHTS